jgi:sugar lactone lactonase YvrE
MSAKTVLTCIVCLLFFHHNAQNHKLRKLWESEKNLKVPESVLYHKEGNLLFFSSIDGHPTEKDGTGFIGKMGLDGKIISADWVKGLNAPKGMGIYNDMLFVSDIDEVIAIDIKTGSIVLRTPIAGARFLNDITISSKGVVYVSDMVKGTVHTIESGKSSDYLNNLEGINGLTMVNDELYLLAKGSLWKARSATEIMKIAEGMDESTDGLESAGDGNFVVSAWNGVIYYVTAGGKVQQLLDTRPEKYNTADIGFDRQNKVLYVPTFFQNSIVAYELK